MSNHRFVLVDEINKQGWTGPIVGAEIGVFKGRTAHHLLSKLPDLSLILVDLWQKYPYEDPADATTRITDWESVFIQAMQAVMPYKHRTEVVRMDTVEAAATIPDDSLDFVFIDGDHRYAAVWADVNAWWTKIKSGGILFAHDYGWKSSKLLLGTKRAYDDFGEKIGQKPTTHGSYVCSWKR